MSARRYDSYAVGTSRTILPARREEEGRSFRCGFVVTKYGVVGVWTGYDDKRAETCYTFVYEGRDHRMFEPVTRTDRGLSTVAGRFAREILSGGAQ